MSHPHPTIVTVIAPDKTALRVGSAKLIVDGTDTALFRKAEIALRPSRVRARLLTQLLQLSRDIYNGALQHRRDKDSSRECNVCGHAEAANRCRSRFICRRCRHEEHADVNAAQVLTSRGQVAETSWRAAGCPVAKRPVPRNQRRQAAEPTSSTGPGRLHTQKSREGAT